MLCCSCRILTDQDFLMLLLGRDTAETATAVFFLELVPSPKS